MNRKEYNNYMKNWHRRNAIKVNAKRRNRYKIDDKYRQKILKEQKKYQHSERYKKLHQISDKKYRESKKGRATRAEYDEKNKARIDAEHYQKNKEKIKKQTLAYKKSKNGKLTVNKSHAKRKRNLGFIQLFNNPFHGNLKIDWHHINDAYVVALPKELHRLYNNKNHRENTIDIVKQIYLV